MNAKLKFEFYQKHGRVINFDSPPEKDRALTDAFKMKPEEAIRFFEAKGYKITWDWKAIAAAAHKKAFTAAKVVQADLLQFYKNELQESLKKGTTFQDFKKKITERLGEAGWKGSKEVIDPVTGKKATVNLAAPSRLQTIFNTNLQSAYMNGRYEQMKETIKTHPYGIYRNADPKSDICQTVKGKVVRLDDANLRLTPFHYNCKTTLDPLSERAAKRLGVTVVDAARTYKQGGGVQESFDSHPDKSYTPDIGKYDEDITAQLSKVIK